MKKSAESPTQYLIAQATMHSGFSRPRTSCCNFRLESTCPEYLAAFFAHPHPPERTHLSVSHVPSITAVTATLAYGLRGLIFAQLGSDGPCNRHPALTLGPCLGRDCWYGSKLNHQELDRRFESMVPLAKVPLWAPIFDPLPCGVRCRVWGSRLLRVPATR